MATVADYVNFIDQAVESGPDIDKCFEDEIDVPVGGQGAMLSWNTRVRHLPSFDGVATFEYQVFVNDKLLGLVNLLLADALI